MPTHKNPPLSAPCLKHALSLSKGQGLLAGIWWIAFVLKNPIRTETQANGRIRRWAWISAAGKYLRVVTEPDGETVHNAFFDRGFRP